MVRRSGMVVLIALLAVSCSSGFETPAETIQRGQNESRFAFVIDEPPTGYALCGVGTPSGLSLQPQPSASLLVYGDGQLADPYEGPLYAVAYFEAGPLADLDLGETTDVEVAGVAMRLGAIDGLLLASLPSAAGRVLTYRDEGGRTVQLAVRGVDNVDLVELATSIVTTGETATIADAGLPDGFVSLGDLYELEAQTEFLFTLDYQIRSDSDVVHDQITLLGSLGDDQAMRAFRFRAGYSAVRDVNGSPGVVAEIGGDGQGPYVVSWLVADEIILRVFSFSLPLEELFAVAQSVRRVDGTEWADLRSNFDPGTCPL